MANISNPRKQFSFSIQIAPLPINPFLAQKVQLPEVSIEAVSHGDTNHDIKTAGRASFGNVMIDKIASTSGADNYFFDWAASCQDCIVGGGLLPADYKRIVTVTELAEDGTSALNTWVLIGAWPQKINGISLDRQGSDNTVESVELCVDKVEKL